MAITDPSSKRSTRRIHFVLGAACLVVIIAGLKVAAPICLPILLALFLTILSLPLLGWLRLHRVPDGLAVLLTMLASVAALSLVVAILVISTESVTDELPRYQERATVLWERTAAWLEARGIDAAGTFAAQEVNLTSLLNLVGSTLSGVLTLVGGILLVLLTMVFMLFEAVTLPAKILRAHRLREFDLDRMRTMIDRIQHYLVLKTLISLGTGLLVGVMVALFGLDFPLLWGFVAFVLNFIPNLGSILAAVPALLLALVQLGVGPAVGIGFGYLAINVLIGNLIEPTVMGRGLRLSPLAIFVALIFWGWVWGPVGMILSVPLTVTLKIFLESFPHLEWLGIFLDRSPLAGSGEDDDDQQDEQESGSRGEGGSSASGRSASAET